MNQTHRTFVQNQIGYEFNNLDLLQQAFTRKSYTEENGGENNEVLEFIGDKVLDFIVVKLLIERNSNSTPLFQKHDPAFKKSLAYSFGAVEPPEENSFICNATEADLTELKKQLVQKKTLANRIDELGIAKFLIMGKGDILSNAAEQPSVREDLFEAILGAIAIDCNWDIKTLQDAVEVMLNPEYILAHNDEENYVSLIQQWTLIREGNIPLYRFQEGSYQSSLYSHFDEISQHFSFEDPKQREVRFHCFLKLSDNQPTFRGFGKTKTESRKNVCKLAYEWLNKNGLWLSIQDELENPNKNDAIGQLEILARRGYFSIPSYDFKQSYDKDGNPIWTCECHITDAHTFFTAKSSSKKEAKKSAAYQMLQYVLKE